MNWYLIDRLDTHCQGPYVITERADVDGGYLVRVIAYTRDHLPTLGVSITFVPVSPKQGGVE